MPRRGQTLRQAAISSAPSSSTSPSPALQLDATTWVPPVWHELTSGAEMFSAPPIPSSAPEWITSLIQLILSTVGEVSELVSATQGQTPPGSDLQVHYDQLVTFVKRLLLGIRIIDVEYVQRDVVDLCEHFTHALWTAINLMSPNIDQRQRALDKLSTFASNANHAAPPSRDEDTAQRVRMLEDCVKSLQQTRSNQGEAREEASQLGLPRPSKPASFDGKRLSHFRAWWLSVEGYFNAFGKVYTDSAKIFFIGSILTDHALEWHQTRIRKFKDLNAADSFSSYAQAIETRFYDPSEPSRNLKRLLKLRYEGSTNTYTNRFQEFNSSVGLTGVALRDIIRAAIPREIANLTFSYLKKGDTSDEGFIDAVNHAGQHHETMNGNIDYLKDVAGPSSRLQSSRSHSSGSNNLSAMQPPKDVSSSSSKPAWPNRAAAFNGVDQSDVDRYRDASAMCIRCGRTNHNFIACFANKNVDGKTLPSPHKIASIKRVERDYEEDVTPPNKKARFGTAQIPILQNLDTDSESDSALNTAANYESDEEDFQ
ncbi:hypothetical protein SEPCBS119000_006728 [Sporothrix epigloea]|uniref:Retrotransposon gag domain-containing protein n=1 Tax=Sporothrix epigloea TaxID=1892477 RepID=A0ABP0E6H8_9PEZI